MELRHRSKAAGGEREEEERSGRTPAIHAERSIVVAD
jgi:hypothetical protein